ncbi:MAG: metallophosphoesterase [Alphaproteobacteria bacterium]|nr:metallophosphoesterase [Alphaproteobacteria bacterium]
MAKFVFSDPHFDSASIIINGQRPFSSVSEMNETLIKNYNETVSKQDICYWLGDIMYGATKDKVRAILQQLRGRKYLIMGNHDRGHSETWWLSCGFDRVYSHPIYDAENYIMLSHEPLPEFGDYDPIANIHGHIHIQDYDFSNHKNCINVCVEKTGYRPVPLVNPFLQTRRIFSR